MNVMQRQDIFAVAQIRHGSDLVIYEMHVVDSLSIPVRGFGQQAGNVCRRDRQDSLFAVDLGVTAVELMPVFQFDPHEGNYWGYMPLNFFSPHHAYSHRPGPLLPTERVPRDGAGSLHAAGIEVILDVVYNHTCEGDHRGPTL